MKKILSVVYNVEDELQIKEVTENHQQDGAPQQPTQEMFRTLSVQINALEWRFNEFQDMVRNNNGDLCTDIGRQLGTVNCNVHHLVLAPACRAAGGQNAEQNNNVGGQNAGQNNNVGDQNGGRGEIPFASTLSRNPRTLYDL